MGRLSDPLFLDKEKWRAPLIVSFFVIKPRRTSRVFYTMDLAQILGWIATILFTVCFIPQIVKMWKTKTVDGLSFLFLLISFVANIIALVYATLIHQPPLQIKYILALLFLAPCLLLYVQIWRKEREWMRQRKE